MLRKLPDTPQMDRYFRPSTLAEALDIMAEHAPRPLAGGTDLYPVLSGAFTQRAALDWMDISGVADLRGIGLQDGGWRIGALASWTDVTRASLPPAMHALAQAAHLVGGRQVQNRGTVMGNLCNASPAADGVPPLLILDAEVELASAEGVRRLALSDFLLGNRRTARRPDELAVALHVPVPPEAESRFEKLGARRQLVISIVMAAGLLRVVDGRVAEARVAVGSCSAVAQRLHGLEAALAGVALADAPAVIAETPLDLTPIADLRGTAEYRLAAARVLAARSLGL